MKKIILFFVAFLLTNCSQFEKQPKCNDEEVQKLVIETIKQHINDRVREEFEDKDFTENENYSDFKPIIETRNPLIDQLEFKLNSIRTDDLKKEIKKCDCQGEISSIEKSNNIDNIKKDLKNIVSGDFRIVGISPTIKYSAQITDDGKIYVTIQNLEELDLFQRNIYAKILYKIRLKNSELVSKVTKPDYNSEEYSEPNFNNYEQNNYQAETTGSYYFVDASPNYPVYFYSTPNKNDRKNSKFTSFEKVYVTEKTDDFGFVEFTNSNNQTSKGWVLLSKMTRE